MDEMNFDEFTALQRANIAFADKQYIEALNLYCKAIQEQPSLYKILKFNIDFAIKKSNNVHLSDLSILISVTDKETCFIQLYAESQIDRHDQCIPALKSTGEDPYFKSLLIADGVLSSGWYEVKFLITAQQKNHIAKLYIAGEEGYSEKLSFRMPFTAGEPFSKVVFFSVQATGIRFDPLEDQDEFEIKYLSFDKLNTEVAENKIIDALLDENKRNATENSLLLNQCINLNDHVELKKLYLKEYRSIFHKSNQEKVSYRSWIDNLESPSMPNKKTIEERLKSFDNLPLLSILVPTYNTQPNFLQECLQSVLEQTYSNWELCIADDASSDEGVKEMLASYAKRDHRIKVNFREVNGNISEASNSALALASGEFVLLLDHDDCLAKEALYFLVDRINECPDADILYSDEDKIDTFGNRFDPHFKGSFNLDLLYSQNYISHLGVYRRDLLNLIGGFRKGYEGAQDYDILLRCLLVSDPSKVIHIPRILYHWRASEGSTALSAGFKSYTHNAGLKAISEYFKEKHIGVEASGGELPNTFRIAWPIPSPKPMVSLIIPTRDRLELLQNCIKSIIEKTKYLNYEILIVDNDSIEPETLEYFYELENKFDQIRILNFKGEFNYSAINNWAVNQARGEIVGLVNNDIEVISPEWLTEMVSHAIRPEIGVVGAKLLYPDYKIQHAGVVIGIGGVAGHSHKYFSDDSHGYFSRLSLVQNYSAVTAACFLVRKEIFTEVGGLDQLNLKIAFNDIDFCLRVSKAGYRNLWTPYAKLFHHESISRGTEDTPEKQARFNQEVEFMKMKWGNLLQCDPFYSPNLTLVHEDFSLASTK